MVKELGLGGTWGDKAAGWNDVKPMGFLLPRSSWHMLELCTVVLSLATKRNSCKLICSNKSLIDSVHSSELLPFRNEWVVISIGSGLSIFLSYYNFILGLFGSTFCMLVLKGWGWNHNVALHFLFPPALPPKIKRRIYLNLVSPLILTELNYQYVCNFRLRLSIQNNICREIFCCWGIVSNFIFLHVCC